MRIEPLGRTRRGLRLAPLVDVVFLLLIFFMLAARLDRPTAIPIAPPASGNGTLAGSVLLRIDTDGDLDLNGTSIELRQLPARLAPYLAREPRPSILLQAAPELPLQRLVQTLDRLGGLGVTNPLLIEQRGSGR